MALRRSLLALFFLSLAAVAPAAAQFVGGDEALLAEVARTYSSLERYVFAGHVRVELNTSKGPQNQEATFLVAEGGGGRLRDQVDHPTEGGAFVSDGKQTWIHNAGLGQWTRRPGGADSALGGPDSRGMGRNLLQRYATITNGALSARRLNDETITIDGKTHPCTVLEVSYRPTTNSPQVNEGPRTYWIERETHLVLRQRSTVEMDSPQLGGKAEQVEIITFTRAQINPVLADSLWRFRPPPGSREVDEIGANQGPTMAGEAAADFTLRDLAGTVHTLNKLKGKVVLLDFWATWCGPCRLTMPRVAKIHEEYKGKGVEVFSINVGEPAARASAFIKKNGYVFTTLLDTDTQVANHYKVAGIPTLVVIDRKGMISSYLVGAHPEQALRDALAKAGVK